MRADEKKTPELIVTFAVNPQDAQKLSQAEKTGSLTVTFPRSALQNTTDRTTWEEMLAGKRKPKDGGSGKK